MHIFYLILYKLFKCHNQHDLNLKILSIFLLLGNIIHKNLNNFIHYYILQFKKYIQNLILKYVRIFILSYPQEVKVCNYSYINLF